MGMNVVLDYGNYIKVVRENNFVFDKLYHKWKSKKRFVLYNFHVAIKVLREARPKKIRISN